LSGNLRKKISLGRKLASESPWISKTALAKTLGFSRRSLYKKPKQPEKDKELLDRVLSVLREHPYYGHRRIAIALGRNTKSILRIMRKYGLSTKRKKKRFKKPRKEPSSGIPNRVKYVSPIGPNATWAGDFTEFRFHGIKVFVATVIDLFTREIVGFSVGLHHTATLVLEAIEDAAKKRAATSAVFHSDQGSEYNSVLVKWWLLAHKILPSHSARGKPWENGFQESFYKYFKQELGNVHDILTIDDLYEKIAHQISYYNTKRIHSVLKMPPQLFFKNFQDQQHSQKPVIHSEN